MRTFRDYFATSVASWIIGLLMGLNVLFWPQDSKDTDESIASALTYNTTVYEQDMSCQRNVEPDDNFLGLCAIRMYQTGGRQVSNV